MSKRRREAQKQRHDQELADLRSKVEKLQAEVNIELERANQYRDKWQADQQSFKEIHSLASTISLDSRHRNGCHCSMLSDKICALVPRHIQMLYENAE
jgi:hypothetical protein